MIDHLIYVIDFITGLGLGACGISYPKSSNKIFAHN